MRYVETAEGKLIDAKGVEARYVRLISNGSDKTPANHYIEVEVYGKPLRCAGIEEQTMRMRNEYNRREMLKTLGLSAWARRASGRRPARRRRREG